MFVNLNIYFLPLICVLIMELSVEPVIKNSFFIVIIISNSFECIYCLNISLKLCYTSYPYTKPSSTPTYNYDESWVNYKT